MFCMSWCAELECLGEDTGFAANRGAAAEAAELIGRVEALQVVALGEDHPDVLHTR